MIDTSLYRSVQAFSSLTRSLSEEDLDRPWTWGDYDDAVRFAFFRVYEELRTLAVKLAQARATSDRPPTTAQRILAQYHAAYCDLQAAQLGVPESLLEQPPVAGEWSVRETLAHIVGADIGFFSVAVHALNQLRQGVERPQRSTLEEYEAIIGMKAADEDAILEGPLPPMQALHARFHRRILSELASITEEELALPSMFWEDAAMSVRWRLHRFDSHVRQHTVQIDKTLVAVNHGPSEAQRLLRLIYAALAEAEGVLIGAPDFGAYLCRETADTVGALTAEIGAVLD